MEKTFYQLFRKGEVMLDAIDDYVEQWHTGTDKRSLSEFLGLTEKQYAHWVENSEMIKPELREVYAKVGTEFQDGTPAAFLEFDEFWEQHKSDDGYVMVYLDTNDKIVQ